MDAFRIYGLTSNNCFFISLTVQILLFVHCESDFIDWSKIKPSVCAQDEQFETMTKGKSINVFYKLVITDLFDVSEERMEFGLQTFVLDLWRDPLLNLTEQVFKIQQTVPLTVEGCLWKPDLIFPNCKQVELYSVTVKNSILKVILEGYILRYSRFNLRVSCPMEFKDYPMDTQKCGLQITMFSHFADKVRLYWMDDVSQFNDMEWLADAFGKSIDLLPGVKPLQFFMGEPIVSKKPFQIARDLNSTVLIVEFTFNRHLTASIINTYIPSFLVVSLSMVSFWLDVTAVPGRITLGVTAMLTLATEIVHARSCLPPVDYMTAMDIWLFGCLVMVFLSLIEFTVAHSIHRKPRLIKQPVVKDFISKLPVVNAWTRHNSIRNESGNVKPTENQDKKHNEETTAQAEKPNLIGKHFVPTYKKDNVLDRYSRIVFPSTMMFFSTTYWLYYVAKKGL